MGQLNIKDKALIERLRRLAERRQTTMVEVLRQAVEREEHAEDAAREARIAAKLAAMREISDRVAKMAPPGATSDHSDLYDEHGAPR